MWADGSIEETRKINMKEGIHQEDGLAGHVQEKGNRKKRIVDKKRMGCKFARTCMAGYRIKSYYRI
jgi:hypothetical protein